FLRCFLFLIHATHPTNRSLSCVVVQILSVLSLKARPMTLSVGGICSAQDQCSFFFEVEAFAGAFPRCEVQGTCNQISRVAAIWGEGRGSTPTFGFALAPASSPFDDPFSAALTNH